MIFFSIFAIYIPAKMLSLLPTLLKARTAGRHRSPNKNEVMYRSLKKGDVTIELISVGAL